MGGIGKNDNDRFNEIKLVKEFDDIISSNKIFLLDKYNTKQGEFILTIGNLYKCSGFYAHGNYIGVNKIFFISGNLTIDYYSIISPGVKISEVEYRKELVKLRFGLIKCPQLSLYLKDYGYEG
jgi:hypothetical protein